MKNIFDFIWVLCYMIGFFFKCAFSVFVFLPIYVLLCPYFMTDNLAEEAHYNYLNHFEDLL